MLITHREHYVRNIKVTFGIIEQFTTLFLLLKGDILQ